MILYFEKEGGFFFPSFKAVLDISHGESPKKRFHFHIKTLNLNSQLSFFLFKKASVWPFKKLAHMNFLSKSRCLKGAYLFWDKGSANATVMVLSVRIFFPPRPFWSFSLVIWYIPMGQIVIII